MNPEAQAAPSAFEAPPGSRRRDASFPDSRRAGRTLLDEQGRRTCRQRWEKMKSLHRIAAKRDQPFELPGVFHTLGDDTHVEVSGNGNDRRYHFRGLDARCQAADEGTVDLQRVEGKVLQIAQ